jgi:putative tricarboxylic transport membrane protein
MTVNRDTIVAILLLVFCAVMLWASTAIRDPGFEQMGAEVWPRIILVLLSGLSLVYLVQSRHSDGATGDAPSAGGEDGAGWFARYQNPIWCFLLFLGFLLAIPYLGMLVAGILFVFLMMSVLGGWTPRLMAMHAVIAILSVGAMWSIFTFGLRVMLPEGDLFQLL